MSSDSVAIGWLSHPGWPPGYGPILHMRNTSPFWHIVSQMTVVDFFIWEQPHPYIFSAFHCIALAFLHTRSPEIKFPRVPYHATRTEYALRFSLSELTRM